MFTTSLTLLERLRDPRDGAAWAELVRMYTPLVRSWLRPHCRQDADADDLTQEVLAVLARKVADFDHNRRMGAFRACPPRGAPPLPPRRAPPLHPTPPLGPLPRRAPRRPPPKAGRLPARPPPGPPRSRRLGPPAGAARGPLQRPQRPLAAAARPAR